MEEYSKEEDKPIEEQKQPSRFKKPLRILAGALALLLILNLVLSDGVLFAVQNSRTKAQQAAAGYLEENTGQSEDVSIQKIYESIQKEDYKAALNQVSACLELLPEGTALHEDLLVKQGCLMALEEDYQAARKTFSRLNALYPENAQAWLMNAQLQLQDGDTQAAAKSMKRYLRLVPGDREQLSVTAMLCYNAQDYEGTLAYGEQALKLDGDANDGALLQCMGLSALLLDKPEAAEGYLSKSIPLLEETGEAHYYLGVCRMALSKPEAAVEDFTAALAAGYSGAETYYNRGICLVAMEQWDDVKSDMEQVAQLSEDPELTAIAQSILLELSGAEDATEE